MRLSLTLNARDVATRYTSSHRTVQAYLEEMILEYSENGEQCLFLPSLVSLSECFKCSPVEVHQALNNFKEEGFDFLVMGFESPITLWCPAKLEPDGGP